MSTGGQGFPLVKKYYIAVNIIITCSVAAMFVSLGVTETQSIRENLAIAGSVVLAFFTLISGLGFAVFGSALVKALEKSPNKTMLIKVRNITVAFSFSFCFEAVLWLASSWASDTGLYAVVFFYLACDTTCLIFMMYMFQGSVNEMKNSYMKSRACMSLLFSVCFLSVVRLDVSNGLLSSFFLSLLSSHDQQQLSRQHDCFEQPHAQQICRFFHRDE
jgi:hypothetical protein